LAILEIPNPFGRRWGGLGPQALDKVSSNLALRGSTIAPRGSTPKNTTTSTFASHKFVHGGKMVH